MGEIVGDSSDPGSVAVLGVCAGQSGAGVKGDAPEGDGVQGFSQNVGKSGVVGTNNSGVGVLGQTTGEGRVGVFGVCTGRFGAGVKGDAPEGDGVQGFSQNVDKSGVVGTNNSGVGVLGQSPDGVGVHATSTNGTGLVASGGRLAALFDGNVEVTGDLTLAGADVAEPFSVVGNLAAEPGSVVVLAGEDGVRVSDEAYDRRVVGVVSGAGNYAPALVLDRGDDPARRPVALTGKVWCNVDADCGAVEVGDLLTTSDTPGYAMKARDASRAFGAVIGKALRPVHNGTALVPILVALQ